MVFRGVIGEVCPTWLPVDMILSLVDSVLNPVKAHVDGLGTLLFYCVIDDAFCYLVVYAQWGCRLGVTKEF